MYILLSGCPPFAGSSDARILQRVQQGSYSFAAKEVRWQEIWCSTCLRAVMTFSPSQTVDYSSCSEAQQPGSACGFALCSRRVCQSLCAGVPLAKRVAGCD